jgi:hypothetical protein
MSSELLLGLGAGVIAVFALVAWAASQRRIRVEDLPPDDASTCAACGNTDLEHPAEGVYRCRCGFAGGPGMPDYQWKLRTERIAAMSEEERSELLASSREEARLKLTAARGDYEAAARSFAEGESILPLGTRGAARKTALYDEVRALLPPAQQYLMEAVGAIEVARHITRGGGRMNAWYDKLGGSRETAFTVTGVQATAALRAQLLEVGDVLTGLERELAA